MIVPVFPLPAAYLFPGTMMPLHVFEPRYVAMVEDLLDAAGRLVIGAVADEHRANLPGSPPIDPVGGLGEIVSHEKLPAEEDFDGDRYIIVLQGLGRVRCREVPSEHAYRLVEVEPLEEEPPHDDDTPPLQNELREAVSTRAREAIDHLDAMDLGALTDLLLMQLRIPQARMSDLFAEPSLARRARGALELHRSQD